MKYACLITLSSLLIVPSLATASLSLKESAEELVQHGGREATVFPEWLHDQGVPVEYQGASASQTGDKVSNLVKFGLGLSPDEPLADRSVLPRHGISENGSFSLVFPRARQAAGIEFSLEISQDLNAFEAAPAALEIVESMDEADLVRLSETADPKRTDARFARLKVELKPDPVPLRAHRLAASLLELSRNQGETQALETARLGDSVVPLYRPDIDGVAYYEFHLFDQEDKPSGYIIVTNGRHDHPIPNWNFEGSPLTTLLKQRAAENGDEATRFYKLDTLFYVAEDQKGREVSFLGNRIAGIKGLEEDMLDKNGIVSAYTGTHDDPDFEKAEDANAGSFEQRLQIDGDVVEFEFFGWEDWRDLKKDFAKAFSVQLGVLRENAARNWEIDDRAEESGEGLRIGQRYPVAILHPLQDWYLSDSKVTEFVDFSVEDRGDHPSVIWLDVKKAPERGEVVFDLELAYANELTEKLRFAVVADSAVEPDSNGAIVASSMATASSSDWNAWTDYWAKNRAIPSGSAHFQQRLYDQFPHSFDGEDSCPVGCGPVAWAMLFGWGDWQAEIFNPSWSGRWGLYREDGGVSTANAIAPREPDGTTEEEGIRNMIKELNVHLETSCTFGGGLTTPWNMPKAHKYLSGRTYTRIRTDYSRILIKWDSLRVKVRDIIRDRGNPALIGIGFAPAHYCLAYGYRWRSRTVKKALGLWESTEYQREFYANMGYGGYQNGWISAETWFAGEIVR